MGVGMGGNRDLAERLLVAMAPLREGTPAALANEAWALAFAFDRESMKPAPAPSLADGEWRDAPRAPASVPTPAIDPRRTVGAVVRNTPNGSTFIVVEPGEGAHKQRASWVSKDCITLPTHSSDEFARWATLDECRQHGIPYVARTAPASKPVDREGLAKAIRRAWWDRIRPDERADWLSAADAAIEFLGGAS